MYKISIYNMCIVTINSFNLSVRVFCFTETLNESRNNLMPKGLLEGS